MLSIERRKHRRFKSLSPIVHTANSPSSPTCFSSNIHHNHHHFCNHHSHHAQHGHHSHQHHPLSHHLHLQPSHCQHLSPITSPYHSHCSPASPASTTSSSTSSVNVHTKTCCTYFQVSSQEIKNTCGTIPVQRQSHSAIIATNVAVAHAIESTSTGPSKKNSSSATTTATQSLINPARPSSSIINPPLPVANRENATQKNTTTTSTETKMIIFGGYKGRKYYNDLYEFDCEKRQWSQIPVVMSSASPGQEAPKGRMWHSGVFLEEEEKMIIFGGETDDEKDLNDMYEYDLKQQKWTQIKPSASDVWPCTRSCHSTVLRKRKKKDGKGYSTSMVIFGGNNDGHKMNDLYEYLFDEKKWKKLSDGTPRLIMTNGRNRMKRNTRGISIANHPPPQGHSHHATTATSMLIDGEEDDVGHEVNNEIEKIPRARYNHTAVMRNKTDKMYIFGGKSGQSRLDDLWCFDFQSGTWQEVETFGHKPTPRSVHSVVMLEKEDQMILFGGYNGNCKMNDMYCLDFSNMKWRQLTIYGDIPNPTSNLSLVCSQIPNKNGSLSLYMFGGYNGDYVVNDMYEIQLRIICDEETILSQDGLSLAQSLNSKLYISSCCSFSDLMIRVQDTSFECHKCIVSQCKKIDYLLRKAVMDRENEGLDDDEEEEDDYESNVTMKESLVLNDISLQVFEEMMAFMYGVPNPKIGKTDIVDLVRVCKQYGLDNMVIYVLNELKQNLLHVQSLNSTELLQNHQDMLLNTKNILHVLERAHHKGEIEIENLCIKFMRLLPREMKEEILSSNEFAACKFKDELLAKIKNQEKQNCQDQAIDDMLIDLKSPNIGSPTPQIVETKTESSNTLQQTAPPLPANYRQRNNNLYYIDSVSSLHKHIQSIFVASNSSRYNALSPISEKCTRDSDSWYCDVIIASNDNEKFCAHKSILASRCPYFASLFAGRYQDSRKQSIKMDQINGKTLKYILEYIYGLPISIEGHTGSFLDQKTHHFNPHSVTLKSQHLHGRQNTKKSVNEALMDIACAASMLLISELENDCSLELSKRITPDNALSMLRFSSDMQILELKKASMKELEQSHSKVELIEIIDNLLQNV